MRHPIISARSALVEAINRAIASDAVYAGRAECFDWRPAAYAKDVAVIVAGCDAEVSRDTIASNTRIQFMENWVINLHIVTTPGTRITSDYDRSETASVILGLCTIIQDELAVNYLLDGSEDLVWCRPISVALDEQEDDSTLFGTMELGLQFRVNRR